MPIDEATIKAQYDSEIAKRTAILDEYKTTDTQIKQLQAAQMERQQNMLESDTTIKVLAKILDVTPPEAVVVRQATRPPARQDWPPAIRALEGKLKETPAK